MSNKPIRFDYRSVEEMKLAASTMLPSEITDYLNAGAAKGQTLNRNRTIFNQWSLIPKRLKGVLHPNTEVSVFGKSYAVPFGAAPVGVQQLFHASGETATAKACTFHKAPCILSTVSNISYDTASKDCESKPWFQLYPTDRFAVTKTLIKNAKQADAEVIVLTVDVPILGKRKHNARALLAQKEFKHLRFGNLDEILRAEDNIHNPGMNWDLMAMIKEETDCKIVLKGILHPDDTELALKHGADGIIVSNHGGRQMESNYSPLEALTEIIKVVPGGYPIFMDGGIRSAEDILKAVLLGAKMVFMGRPICFGLAVGGQAGVDHLLTMLKADLKRCMQLMGIENLSDLDKSQIVRSDVLL